MDNNMTTTSKDIMNKPTTLLRAWACIAVLFALMAFSRGQAQTVPALVNYQGRLANPDGSPLPTADYTLTFNLYNAATNGARVWGPQVFDAAVTTGHGARVPVVQGWFNVMLGPVDTIGVSLADAFTNASCYVEVTVSNRPPIAPRQQILTTPFAFQAANSAKLAGYDWSAVFGTNNPVTGTIPFSKLAQREVGTNVGVGGVALSLSSGTNVVTNVTAVDVPKLIVTLQTSGRPVFVGLVCDTNTAARSSVYETPAGTPWIDGEIQILQNLQPIARFGMSLYSSVLQLPPSAFSTVAFPAAGTWTFSVKAFVDSAPERIEFINIRLVAFEL